jgi:hypothetical protein
MSKVIAAIVLGLAALAGGVWLLLRPPSESAVLAAIDGARTGSARAQAPAAAGRIASLPASSPAPARVAGDSGAARPAVPLKSELAREFEKARHMKPFYDRYAADPGGADAETRYFAAVAMERCIGRSKGTNPTQLADQQSRFQSRLKIGDPMNEARQNAFNRIYELCEGFGNVAITAADVQKMYREAAAQGNQAAKVAVASTDYQSQLGRARGVEERRLSEEHLATLRDALSSGDPFAIERVGQMLASSTQLAERRVGPNGDPYNPRDWGPAWQLLACDRGANCGADSQRVLNGCAWNGACGYDSLETYMQFNELPPNVYQAVLANRALIAEAIAQGRWDWLGIAPGMGRSVTPGTSMQANQGSRPAPPAPVPAPSQTPRKGG